MTNVTSWLLESVLDLPLTWSDSEISQLHSNKICEMNRRFREIYEEVGVEYGDDVGQIELAKRFKVAEDFRKTNIKCILKSIKNDKNVQVCFLVEATESMQAYMDDVKKSIDKIVDLLKSKRRPYPETNVCFSMVAYRDSNVAKQFEVYTFNSLLDKFKLFCDGITADGGECDEESICQGFQQAIQLKWSNESKKKVIFHIADSCRRSFNTNRCLDGIAEIEIFNKLCEKEIEYYFGAVAAKEDVKMDEMFSKACAKKIVPFDLKKIQGITQSVFNSIFTFTSRIRDVFQRTRIYDFDLELPLWPELPPSTFQLLTFKMPKSIKDIINKVPFERCRPRNVIVKVAPNPFAHGSERYAFYGLDVTTPSKTENVVLKECIVINTGKPVSPYQSSNQTQLISSFFATKYSNIIRQKTGFNFGIKFLKVQTLCIPISETENRYFSYEKQYEKNEKFIRFTNNADYEMMAETAEKMKIISIVWALTAFSHWTYQITSGYLMIVDLQGIITKEKENNQDVAILTDPAIHCVDKNRFGRTNLGEQGFKMFFGRHKCNEYCVALKLNPVVYGGENEGKEEELEVRSDARVPTESGKISANDGPEKKIR